MNSSRPGPSPVDRVRGLPPDDPEWRADAMAQSRHSRLDDVLIEPLEDRDTDRAALLCGEVTRRALLDFAPAVVLIPAPDRRRFQALAAFSLTLFDFARQSSLEGEKLAQMNRWHFDLESTLDGEPPGQPVFVLLADTDEQSPWPREALDGLVACARHRALHQRPRSQAEAAADSLRLGGALSRALVPGGEPGLAPLAAALLRVGRLLALGDDGRRHQAGLAMDELPEAWGTDGPLSASEFSAAIRTECTLLEEILSATRVLRTLPPPWRRAATYAVLAARRLLARLRVLGVEAVQSPPRLGAVERLRLLVRSRLLPL